MQEVVFYIYVGATVLLGVWFVYCMRDTGCKEFFSPGYTRSLSVSSLLLLGIIALNVANGTLVAMVGEGTMQLITALLIVIAAAFVIDGTFTMQNVVIMGEKVHYR